MSEYNILQYVAKIDFERDAVACFMEGDVITTLVHIAPYIGEGSWELAISVAENCRGLGLATHMLEQIKPLAATRGWKHLSVLYESNNTAVAKLCSRTGLSLRGYGSERSGVWESGALRLPTKTRVHDVGMVLTQ
jgi:ribosomal protein S18 acetylase RimI-like enzyme